MNPYSAPLEGRTGKNYLLLDFNERTIPPHPLVLKELARFVQKGRLQLYPEYGDIKEIIADYVGVSPRQIIITVGSDQGIDIVNRALVSNGDKVIIPKPTFAMLEQAAKIQGAEIIPPLYKGKKYEFPFAEVIGKINYGVKLVVLCKPNNPTGTPISKEQSEAIIRKAAEVGAGILADETYHEYAPEFTVMDLVNKYSNLFVTRTFSKTMGIPSLRAGIIISQKQNIAELEKIRGPYDVSMPAVVALRALRHKDVRKDIAKYVTEVMQVSKPMVEAFYKKHKIRFVPSAANFHLVDDRNGSITLFLKSKNILVRPRSDIKGTARVSIGTRENTRRYLEVLQAYLKLSK